MTLRQVTIACLGTLLFAVTTCAGGDDGAESSSAVFDSTVLPFVQSHCVKCHGPTKSKGGITLHKLASRSMTDDVELWEQVLEMLESGEMPPIDEKQPSQADRATVIQWIEGRLRDHIANAGALQAPLARRLTNFEYENTMRDLLGFELKLIDYLPKDPVKPYRFNNSAEFMRLGPEQIDRYLECARRAMASAIVAPTPPAVHKLRREFQPYGLDKGLGLDEVGVWGNRRHSPAHGIGLKSFPKRGEYRIRVKASAILPSGVKELPLRLVMGYGLNVNSATQQIEPVGTVRLSNSPDNPEVFEFRGRIENYPVQPGRVVRGKRQPDSLVITPQNIYDDGTLNDGRRDLAMPRAVIHWIEFESPIVSQWPPEHHRQILFDSPLHASDPKKYVREVLTRFMRRAFRRPATVDEVDRFVRIYELVAPELESLEAAMRETLAMVLVSPQFMYHTVAAEGVVSRQYELASKLSYFLWGSMPDDELLRLAAAGKLDEPESIAKQVRRLLADERSLHFVDNFATQWLSLSKLKSVPINRELFPRFLYYVAVGERRGTEVPYRPTIRDYMHAETVGFVAELLRRNVSVLNIVDSDFAYLNQPLAAHYGVAGVQGDELRPVAINSGQRLGGLLTHGSILIGNGTGSAPHPIYRAVWLREAILGDEVPPPPADVPALSDSAGDSAEKALTIADLLRRHRKKESCNDCHSRLDPWGLPFERYNAIGKFQPLVPKEGARVSGFSKQTHRDLAGYAAYLESINTNKVEAQARVPQGPLVDGMRDLKEYLLQHRKDDIAENVLRRLLTYGIGRELSWRDRFAVEEMVVLAEKRDYKMQDMIILICQSPLFQK